MKGADLRKTVASCVIGAGCVVGIPALAHAQAATAAAAKDATRADEHNDDRRNDHNTRTPIKHVIYIIGENRTFDHIFATYVPRDGQSVWNLLSEGIIKANGRPGPNFGKAQQWQATDTKTFSLHPEKTSPFGILPAVNTDGAPAKAPFSSIIAVRDTEPALLHRNDVLLTTGGTGQPDDVADTRFPAALPNGPFDISRYTSYDSYTSSPVHRFYQMWQQTDCDVRKATKRNPSGCQNDLFPWVEVSDGAGQNGAPLPAGFNDETTGEGSTAMGFFNVQAGDVPYFTKLAREYAMSDNFHQAIEGGTGANHIALGFGTLIYYADSTGAPATPPVNQIENPDPQPGTNNWYTQDGYGGGSYVDCADPSKPGIGAVRDYLNSLPYHTIRGDCRRGAYYLVNNYNPGYLGTGQAAALGDSIFTIPPTTQNNIGLLLSQHHISWKYYGEGWANGTETGENSTYCNICNPFLYSTQIMTNPNLRKNLQDVTDLYDDIQRGTLPAVSIVKPDGYLDGHPASSKWDLYEAFTRKIVEMVQKDPKLFSETAIMITEDEGGGYYDSGYIQPLDFFGDGTRIPLLVVSPYTKGVGVVHSYGDHVSFDKFVEANWGLETIARNSRDNLPNPITRRDNAYAPVNAPALSDLMDMFDFHRHEGRR